MKVPKIKDWDCVDHDPIDAWIPDDPSDVDFWCNLAIGIDGEAGADNFLVHIATERALGRIEDKNYLFVVPYYESWDQLLIVLESFISDFKDIGWTGMSEQLSRHFLWEYDSKQ